MDKYAEGRGLVLGALWSEASRSGDGELVAAVALAVVALTTIILSLLVDRQPRRWTAFYSLFFLAALATAIGLRAGGADWEVTAQVLGLMAGLGLVWACVGDGFSPRIRRVVSYVSAAVTAAGSLWVIATMVDASPSIGSLNGVRIATAIFLAQVTTAGVLMTIGYEQIPARAIPMLPPLAIAAIVAAGLWVMPEDVGVGGIGAHDLAMLVAAACLLLLWGLNQLRFNRRDFVVVEVSY